MLKTSPVGQRCKRIYSDEFHLGCLWSTFRPEYKWLHLARALSIKFCLMSATITTLNLQNSLNVYRCQDAALVMVPLYRPDVLLDVRQKKGRTRRLLQLAVRHAE